MIFKRFTSVIQLHLDYNDQYITMSTPVFFRILEECFCQLEKLTENQEVDLDVILEHNSDL